MLILAFTILAIGVLLGSALAIHYLRSEGAAAPPWWLAAVHMVVALGGLGCLLLALAEPPRSAAHGTGSFGTIAATLFVAAALAGGAILAARSLKRRPAGILIAIHAMLAVSGFVILAAYVLVR